MAKSIETKEITNLGEHIWKKDKSNILLNINQLNVSACPLGISRKDEEVVVKWFANAPKRITGNSNKNSLTKRLKDCTKFLGFAKKSSTIRKIYEQKLLLFTALQQTDNAIKTNHYLLNDHRNQQGDHIKSLPTHSRPPMKRNLRRSSEKAVEFIEKRSAVPQQCVTAKEQFFCILALTHENPHECD